MNSCKIALNLWRAYKKEREKALFTGYRDDMVKAHNAYVQHIEGHGCWKEGAAIEW